MWLVVMTMTLASVSASCFSETTVFGARAGSRGRVHAAMKHEGTETGACWARNSVGELPTMLLKVRLKVPRLAKPTSHAMSVTGRSVCPAGSSPARPGGAGGSGAGSRRRRP